MEREVNTLAIQPGIDPTTRELAFRISIKGGLPTGHTLEEDGIGVLANYEELMALTAQLVNLVTMFEGESPELPVSASDLSKLN